MRHYKHFLQYFDRYDARERTGRRRLVVELKSRLVEARHSDGEIGLWHAFASLHPGERRDGRRFVETQHRIARMVRRHYPAVQAMKMMMKPLRLSSFWTSLLQPLLTPAALLIRQMLLR